MSSKTDAAELPHGVVELSGALGQAARGLAVRLLAEGAVGAVFTLRRTAADRRYCAALISDPALLEEASPFHPVMPVQGARVLSGFLGTGSPDRRIAAFLRPCELRAFVENVKQHKGGFDDLLVISCRCAGVLPASRLADDDGERLLADYMREAASGGLPGGIRDACARCVDTIPTAGADMILSETVGPAERSTMLHLMTDRAVDAARLLSLRSTAGTSRGPVTTAGPEDPRRRNREALLASGPEPGRGLGSLVEAFASCIGCRACREACPLCHCILCDYETERTRWSPGLVRDLAESRGALRVPAGTIQFHLGRLVHISPVCVSCGQCSEVCPAGIPVSDLFARASAHVQASLRYVPGADPDGAPPLATYVERELEDLTD